MAKNRIGFSNDFVLKDEQIGINTTSPRATLDVEGDSYVSGITTSVGGFYGDLYGTFFGIASTATSLENPRTFEITGDVVASPIVFDGTGNVSLAATIQPNSVGLGTDTFGDYVKGLTGTTDEIVVTGGTGEGSTPVISLALNPTIGGNVVVGNDLQVNNNLNVTGNITIGGTSAIVYAQEFRVADKDIVLGFTTDTFGNDVSNDTTANGGGIAIASTEGNPLVCLSCAGINTFPGTYKQLIWYKAGAFSGLNTDAWLSNYAIGIGSTQVPNGVRLAAGGVQITDSDIIQVGNINASGIVTATTFYGDGSNLDNIVATSGNVNYAGVAGIATYADTAGIATYANLSGIATYAVTAGVATYAGVSGISTYAGVSGISTYAVTAGVSTYAGVSGVATVAQGLTGTPNLNVGIVTATEYYGTFKGTIDSGVSLDTANYANIAGIATYAVTAGVSTYAGVSGVATYAGVSGIATYSTTSGIATYATTAGISTVAQGLTGTPNLNVGIVTATEYYGTFKGTIDSGVSLDTANYANVAGVSTNVIGGIASVTQLSVSGLSTFTGIGTFQSDLYVGGNVSVVGILTADRLYSNVYGEFTGGGISGTNIVGTALSISGISTFTGIGTFVSDLYVGGDVNIVGVLTAERLYSNIYGEFVGGGISGDSIVGTALSISGISTLGSVQISSGIVTAVSGVVTYYGDGSKLTGIAAGGGGSGEFNTGISSSIQLTPLSYETSIYTFPSTSGKQYVIESINVANVDTSVGVGTTVNIIASIQDSTGEQTYIAYNVPIVNGGLIELLKNPIVAGPSDVMKMWVTDGNYIGVNNAAEVYMNYTEFTSTEYISEYASTVSIATTDSTAVYTSSTYPSTIEAIHFANRTDIGDYPVSVSITNGLTTTYLAKNLIIPRYSTVDILDRPKRVEVNGTVNIEVGQTSTIDVIIAGKQIV